MLSGFNAVTLHQMPEPTEHPPLSLLSLSMEFLPLTNDAYPPDSPFVLLVAPCTHVRGHVHMTSALGEGGGTSKADDVREVA